MALPELKVPLSLLPLGFGVLIFQILFFLQDRLLLRQEMLWNLNGTFWTLGTGRLQLRLRL